MGDLPFDHVLAAMRGAPRDHDELARWIEGRWGTRVLAIVEDRYVHGPRLAVWFRTEDDMRTFRDANSNFDAARQREIAERWGSRILVVFAAAERRLRTDLVRAIPDSSLTAARATLDDPSTVWQIYGLNGQIFVFLFTDEQVAALRGGPQHVRLVDELWRIVQAHDEFDVVPRDLLVPQLDSKQNYDENFQGNGYYYHR